MSIGTTESKRADTDHQLLLRLGERLQRRRNLQPKARQIHAGIGLRIMQAFRDHSLPETQHGFDETRNACSSFRMPHIGFHRAKQAGIGAWPPLTQHRAKGSEFNRIPLASPCAMGFYELRCRRRQPSRGIGGLHTRDLSFFVGCSQALTAAIGIHRGATDHRFNRITVAQGSPQRLKEYSTGAFGTHIAIRLSIKAAAVP